MQCMKNRQGFSLVEVMVACLVLSLLAAAAAGMFAYNSKAAVEARRSDIALNLARARLEMLKAGTEKTLEEKYPGFETDYDSVYAGDYLKKITVTVSYRVHGQEKKITLSALEAGDTAR